MNERNEPDIPTHVENRDAIGAPAPAADPLKTEHPPPAQSAQPPPRDANDERLVHQYAAVSNRREQVLTAFETERAAILKAVADQRAAALAPIEAVNAKRAGVAPAPEINPPAINQPGGAARPRALTGLADGVLGARRRLRADWQRFVAAEIISALKAFVAAEVRRERAKQMPTPEAVEDENRPHALTELPAIDPYVGRQVRPEGE